MSTKARFQPQTLSPGKSRPAATSKLSAASGSKRGGVAGTTGAATGSKSAIQVVFNGKIVTPQSLVTRKYAHSKPKRAKEGDMGDVPTIDETADMSEKVISKPNKLEGKKSSLGSALIAPPVKKEKEEMCIVCLRETKTEIVFEMPSFIASSDTRDIAVTDERNARYDAIVLAHKNADGYASKPTQTMNYTLKNQNEMAAPNALQDFGCQADNFNILDATRDSRQVTQDELGIGTSTTSTSTGTDSMDFDEAMGFSPLMKKQIRDMTSLSLISPDCLLDENSISRPVANNNAGNKAAPKRGNKQGQSVSGVSRAGSESQGDDKQPSGSGFFGATSNADVSGDTYGLSGNGEPPVSGMESNGVTGGERNGGEVEYADINSDEIFRQKETEKLLSSPSLLKRLQIMERAVQQNSYHRQQLDYRDLPDIAPLHLLSAERVTSVESNDQLFGLKSFSKGSRNKPGTAPMGKSSAQLPGSASNPVLETTEEDATNSKVKKLFSLYNSELVQGRSISAMAWNAVNTDLLAVGYGRLSNIKDDWQPGKALDESKLGGLVLFWSLRNPDYPEKILRTSQPVTALDFSKNSPTMLAVGFLNGDVSFYDVKREGDWGKPIESSTNIHGGHSDPVWQMSWVQKSAELAEEVLVTISTDGTVLEWNLKKGLAVSKLMQLKKSGVVEGWISREAAGLCFDFCPTDATTYVVGTEEGTLHRCSVSYNEQFLDTYTGLTGPVYKTKFSDRWPSVFLSCSADWSINLYHLYNKNPWLSLKIGGEDFAVNDINWCPGNSTVFASVNSNGKLHIWDLSESSIDPVVTVDTNQDDVVSQLTGTQGKSGDEAAETEPPSVPATPAILTRFDRNNKEEEKREPPVTKLLNSLTSTAPPRELTCVRFGLSSPIIAVGDSVGTIAIYRVLEPVTIMHEGPLQQLQRLRAVLTRNLDPAQLEALAKADSA